MCEHAIDILDQYAVLYGATLEQAAQAGESIMATVLAVARQSLKDRATKARGLTERDHLELALKLLDSNSRALCERYPQTLTIAFRQAPSLGGEGAVAFSSLHFDQLELMDSAQVQESVELARAQQSAMLAAEAALAELNTYICATLGMKAVQPERNPLRPEVFVRALQSLLAQTQVTSLVRMDWLQHMSPALGKELSVLYSTLSLQLQDKGVKAAGYAVVRTHEGASRPGADSVQPSSRASSPAPAARQRAQIMRDREETVLTLDRLRRLLVGELDHQSVVSGLESFSAQFSREFESGGDAPAAVDFEATVPAAFEALQEMKQVDHMMERIDKRRRVGGAGGAAGLGYSQEVREHLQRGTYGLGQALSLEVVALMVENISQDSRLLDPIRSVIRKLEPALLRLALVDPRFFSDKQHPARRLLQEITHRSLAYDAVDARGFDGFLKPLQRVVESLAGIQIEGAQPFEQVLQKLVQAWDERKPPSKLEETVKLLERAEQRNLLASKLAREIAARPDTQNIPAGVLDFLYGPWAQVMAHARITDGSGSDDPGQYRDLVSALLWSVQPELTRKNSQKLTRLVPKLLGKLRTGLDLIEYPSLKTSAFFELLMKLHQQAFRPPAKAAEPPRPDSMRPGLFDEGDSWLAPVEAKVSGFMEGPAQMAPSPLSASALTEAAAPTHVLAELAPVMDKPVVVPADVCLPVGAWVELLTNGAWIRTQLSWASPLGTLFLFTSAYGSTQSMTRRTRDKLLAADTMRIVSGQPIVDGALDAVAQTAMLNSIDVRL